MKVGDKVICTGGMSKDKIAKIERETKLYWIVGNTKYCKKTLYSPGTWSTHRIKEYSEGLAKDIIKQNMIDYISYKTIDNLSYEQIKHIYLWIKSSESEK